MLFLFSVTSYFLHIYHWSIASRITYEQIKLTSAVVSVTRDVSTTSPRWTPTADTMRFQNSTTTFADAIFTLASFHFQIYNQPALDVENYCQTKRMNIWISNAIQTVRCVTGRQWGNGAGVHRSTVASAPSGSPDVDAGGHGERKSGAGLSGAMSSVVSTPTACPTLAPVSMAVASDVITLDWKNRSGM